jgi:hypothetical protein
MVPLQPLFTRLAADFAPQALAHGLGLRIVPTTLTVVSDPVLLERILRNYVTNAVRYTPAGGIVVGARRRGAAIRIDVVDSGIGIARELHARIFDEFVQGGSEPRHAAGRGMGLGLAIVRRTRCAARALDRRRIGARPGIALLGRRAARRQSTLAHRRPRRRAIRTHARRPHAAVLGSARRRDRRRQGG